MAEKTYTLELLKDLLTYVAKKENPSNWLNTFHAMYVEMLEAYMDNFELFEQWYAEYEAEADEYARVEENA